MKKNHLHRSDSSLYRDIWIKENVDILCFDIFLVPLENPYHPLKNTNFESVLWLQCSWLSIYLELKTITFYTIKNKVKKWIIILREPRIYATIPPILHIPSIKVVSPKNTIFINLRIFKVSKLYHLKLICSILV